MLSQQILSNEYSTCNIYMIQWIITHAHIPFSWIIPNFVRTLFEDIWSTAIVDSRRRSIVVRLVRIFHTSHIHVSRPKLVLFNHVYSQMIESIVRYERHSDVRKGNNCHILLLWCISFCFDIHYRTFIRMKKSRLVKCSSFKGLIHSWKK